MRIFQLTEGKTETISLENGVELRLYHNPSRNHLINLLSMMREMRGVAFGNDVWFFDAMLATHVKAERGLIALGLVQRTDALETLFATPAVQQLNSSYGPPRPIDDRFVLRCDNRWDAVEKMPQIARLLQPVVIEGRVHVLTLSYSSEKEEVLIIENPTREQAKTLLERSRQEDGSFYIRGLCIANKKFVVWDGWKATHDDVRVQFFPKVESHDSELTTFEASNRDGFQVLRQGDYDVRSTRWYNVIMHALGGNNLTEAQVEGIGVEGGDNSFRFDVHLDHGAEMNVFVDFHPDTGVMEVTDIWTKAGQHPESFKVNTRSGSEYYTTGVRLGTQQTRGILRYIIDHVRKFGRITSIEGARLTGARAFNTNRSARARLQESVMMLDILNETVKVISKPTVDQIIGMMATCPRIRGLADGPVLYIWDGYSAAHFQIAAALGLDRPIEFQITNYDNDPRIVIYNRDRATELTTCPTFVRLVKRVNPIIMG